MRLHLSQKHHVYKSGMTAVMCAALVLGLAVIPGCKYTDVLTEHIEDPENGVIDQNQDAIYKEVQGAPENSSLTSTLSGSSTRIDDQTAQLPVYDENAGDNGLTANRVYDPNSSHDVPATQGTDASDQEGQSTNGEEKADEGESSKNDEKSQDDGSSTDDAADGDEASDEADASDESQEGDDDTGGDDATGGGGGTADVYDDGTYDKLPENVGSVAAVGQYATIVQMLAGEGGLAAADSNWISAVKKSGAFAGEGVDKIATGWSGDGGSSGTAKISALIKAKPDVVLLESGTSSLNASQQKKLTSNGINVVVMPDLGESDTPDKDITKAVKIVAELLKKADTAYDASAMAQTYVELHDEAIESCLDANGGYSTKSIGGSTAAYIYQGTKNTGTATTKLSSNRMTTAFIDSWTTSVRSNQTAVRRYSGAELYLNGKKLNVSEGVGVAAKGSTDNFMLLDYYFQVSGVVNNAYDTSKPSVGKGSLSYLVIPGSADGVVTKTAAQRSVPSALWYNPTSTTDTSSWLTVGDAEYPAIVTRSTDIAKKVKSSAGRTNGMYNVGQSYEIWVMPSSKLTGSWSTGTVDSFLAAPWVYGMFQLDSDLGTCSAYADSFYQTFMRCDTSDVVDDYGTIYKASCPTQ